MQEFFSFFLSKVKIGIFLLFGSYQKINSQKNQKNERKIRFFLPYTYDIILLFTPKFSHQLFCSTWPHMISLRIFAKHYRRSWKTACILYTLHPIIILIDYRISSTLVLLEILITNLLSSGKRGKIITRIMKNNRRSWS